MGIILGIIYIIGFLTISFLFGKLFVIGIRILFPFKIHDLKENLSSIICAFTLYIVSLVCMLSTALGAIGIIILIFEFS